MKNPKVFAMYLPQYHRIPENDEFWGKGFTDWCTVKKAKPFFEGHIQPKIPLDDNYYDLSKKENVEWQAKLAYEHGIYGFGVYHYWFNNDKNILTRPAEILRDSRLIHIKYFFSWDNANWIRSWSNVRGNDWAPIADSKTAQKKGPQILIPYILGAETDWRNHYAYVRTHFMSPNYEKYENKPLFSIIGFSQEILRMCSCWNRWAKEDGFGGICFIFQNAPKSIIPDEAFLYRYEPHYVGWFHPSFSYKLRTYPKRFLNKILKTMHISKKRGVIYLDYDIVWLRLLRHIEGETSKRIIQGAFVDYDDSPRRGNNGSKIFKGATPEKFRYYFSQLYAEIKKQEKPYIFLTAWNEWGEGAYLEPDKKNGYGYLLAIKEVLFDEKYV